MREPIDPAGSLMNKENLVQLENSKNLSESVLWTYMEDYYIGQGIDAWASDVPYFVTNNCRIASEYAMLLYQLMSDGLRSGDLDKNEKIYVVEGGSGSGMLAYRILNELEDLMTLAGRTDIDYCYIMTDLVDANIDYWKTNQQLLAHCEKGRLDFAKYNINN